jgi:hypothetical protein
MIDHCEIDEPNSKVLVNPDELSSATAVINVGHAPRFSHRIPSAVARWISVAVR